MPVLLQTYNLNPYQTAVRERFQEGGSITATLLVIAGVAAAVLLAYLLTRQQRRANRVDPMADPRQLFRDLQTRLKLSPKQRCVLDTVAEDLDLEHPAVLLLSPMIFDRCVGQWCGGNWHAAGRAKREVGTDGIAETRSALFGEA